MTDSDFMLAVLREHPGEWVSQMELLRRSESARGCGMTPHSRASDLRNRGLTIENRCERAGTRVISYYRLIEPSLTPAPVSAVNPESPSAGIGADASEVALAQPRAADRGNHSAHHHRELEEPASLTLFDEPPRKREPAWR